MAVQGLFSVPFRASHVQPHIDDIVFAGHVGAPIDLELFSYLTSTWSPVAEIEIVLVFVVVGLSAVIFLKNCYCYNCYTQLNSSQVFPSWPKGDKDPP